MKSNIQSSFNKLKDFMFFNHHGILVERCGDKYRWCGRVFDSLEELDEFREEPNPGIKVVRPENKSYENK